MPHFSDEKSTLAPYRRFSRKEWAHLRADTPMLFTQEDISELKGVNEYIDLDEVEAIYLPLARLLMLYVSASQSLFQATQKFLGGDVPKVPYILAIAGSVAAGKSTTARVLQRLLSTCSGLTVDLIATDGFLLPNKYLTEKGLMEKKGFPESYDRAALIRFLSDVKAGTGQLHVPKYSHLVYDVVPGETISVNQPDILIVEGLNVLQAPLRRDRAAIHVSDFFDFSIYLDAEKALLKQWYIERFFTFRQTIFQNPNSYFRKYVNLSDQEAFCVASRLWDEINLRNLEKNILPTRHRADLILRKEADHAIHAIWLRRL